MILLRASQVAGEWNNPAHACAGGGSAGAPDLMRLRELAAPQPGPGEVVVAVDAAGANPVDAGSRADPAWADVRPLHGGAMMSAVRTVPIRQVPAAQGRTSRVVLGLSGPGDQLGTLNVLAEETTAAVARLVRRGATSNLDDPLSTFVPSLAGTARRPSSTSSPTTRTTATTGSTRSTCSRPRR